jgi:DNA-binding MarR family transcriptional regulator
LKRDLIRAFERYVGETLGVTIHPRRLAKPGRLPFFLLDSYAFYVIHLLNRPFLVLVPNGDDEQTPATIRSHADQVQKLLDYRCIYVQPTISSFNRKRLIAQRVPFVVPHNQMYLPDLGIDLREHYKRRDSTERRLSPATQSIIIHVLLNHVDQKTTPSSLARRFGYSAMTMSRTLNEIEAADLAETNQEGRERWLYFTKDRRDLWEKTQPLMRSPVKRHLWIQGGLSERNQVVEAGLSALSRYSMLSPPGHGIYAASTETWQKLRISGVEERPGFENGNDELEIWSYDPGLFSTDRVADPFSIYLSLRETRDERVESALEEMMGRIQW